MIIEAKAFQLDAFKIPLFELNEGEIITLLLRK